MLAAERGAGKNTLDAYRNDLADLAAHLRAAGTTIAGADTDDLRGFLERARRARLQGLLAGAAAVGGAPALSLPLRGRKTLRRSGRGAGRGPSADAPCRKCSRSPKSTDCWRRRARTWKTPSSRRPQRLRAARLLCLLEVVYATGLRVSELVALPAAAARRDQRMLVVRGKGGKERLVPLNQAAKRAMAEYLELRGEAKRDGAIEMAVPVVRRAGPPHPSAFRARIEGARLGLRDRAGAPLPARAAACLRQPSAAQRRRSARGADPARPRRHLDHADLHPCAGGTAEGAGARPASAGRRLATERLRTILAPSRPHPPPSSRSAPARRTRSSKPVRDSIGLLSGLGVEGDAHLGVTVKHRSRVARIRRQPQPACRFT